MALCRSLESVIAIFAAAVVLVRNRQPTIPSRPRVRCIADVPVENRHGGDGHGFLSLTASSPGFLALSVSNGAVVAATELHLISNVGDMP